MDEIEEAKRYWGYFVLVSNEIKDPFDALKAYRSREKIEELFATYKDSFDGRKPRTWYPENLYGRQFAQFVGLGKLFKTPCSQAELNKIVPFGFSLQRQKMVFFCHQNSIILLC